MTTLTLGYSPCPNDTFVFYGLIKGKIYSGGLNFRESLLDVETLNRLALRGKFDATKVSSGALGSLLDEYCLLRSGGAMGRGCGPLLAAKGEADRHELSGKKIAIPGRLTTAYLLLRLLEPALSENVVEMPFGEIMPAVRDGQVEGGLVIHEGRFTCAQYGLRPVLDLGELWEKETGLPLPLGSIIAKRKLGEKLIHKTEALIRESALYALSHPDEPSEYVKAHARELDDEVIKMHIALYVNAHTADMGEKGTAAVEELLRRAAHEGLIGRPSKPLFA